jgi:hypothetical protein
MQHTAHATALALDLDDKEMRADIVFETAARRACKRAPVLKRERCEPVREGGDEWKYRTSNTSRSRASSHAALAAP